MKASGYDLKQHVSAGQFLFDTRNKLLALNCELSKAYGKTSRPATLAKRALVACDNLRNDLDNKVCAENPDCDDITKVYYPTK